MLINALHSLLAHTFQPQDTIKKPALMPRKRANPAFLAPPHILTLEILQKLLKKTYIYIPLSTSFALL